MTRLQRFSGAHTGAEADNLFVGGISKIGQWIKSIFAKNNRGILNLFNN